MQCAVASTSLCPSEHYLMAKNTHTLFWPTKLPSLDLGIRVQNCPTSEVAACRVSPISHPLVTPSFIASVQIYTPAKGESWIARSLWTFWQHLAVRTHGRRELDTVPHLHRCFRVAELCYTDPEATLHSQNHFSLLYSGT